MALIQCPECEAKVSSRATTCPKCGFPIPRPVSGEGGQEPFFDLFFGILAKPREVFEGILAGPRSVYTWPMVLLLSFAEGVLGGVKKGTVLDGILYFIVSIPVYFLLYWLIAYFFYSLGKTMGGTGKPKELFDCVIWGSVVDLLIEPIKFAKLFVTSTDVMMYLVTGGVLIALWSYYFGTVLLSTAHRISMAKAAGLMGILTAAVFLVFFLSGHTWQDSLGKLVGL